MKILKILIEWIYSLGSAIGAVLLTFMVLILIGIFIFIIYGVAILAHILVPIVVVLFIIIAIAVKFYRMLKGESE